MKSDSVDRLGLTLGFVGHERMDEKMQLLQCKIDSSASSKSRLYVSLRKINHLICVGCGDIQDRLQKIQTMLTAGMYNLL